jgi:hypothetical protein
MRKNPMPNKETIRMKIDSIIGASMRKAEVGGGKRE